MDYSFYGNLPIFSFYRIIDNVALVFAGKVLQMEAQGFDLAQFVVFSFSAGAKIAIEGGALLGGRIGKIYSKRYLLIKIKLYLSIYIHSMRVSKRNLRWNTNN